MKKLPVKQICLHKLYLGYGCCVAFHHQTPGMGHCSVHFVVVAATYAEPHCRLELEPHAEKEQVKHLSGAVLGLQKSRF